MDSMQMDDDIAEALLGGLTAHEDAPAGFEHVAALFRAAAAPGYDSMKVLGHEAMTTNYGSMSARGRDSIAAMVAVLSAGGGTEAAPARSPRRSRAIGARLRLKLGAGVLAGTLMLGTGLAAAGVLPEPAQNLASSLLAKVGISVRHHGQGIGSGQNGPGTPKDATDAGDTSHGTGPDVTGPAALGLCNAFPSGQGASNGGRDQSTAFRNLQAAADASGQTVEQFCAGVLQKDKTPKPPHGNGNAQDKDSKDSHGGGTGNGEGGDHGGPTPTPTPQNNGTGASADHGTP
jgi:hypothetical protein